MTRGEKAQEIFTGGYNCSQSVLLAFADLLPVGRDTLARLAHPFGGGFGKSGEVCGAVSGMTMALGLLYGSREPGPDARKEIYAREQELLAAFREAHGSVLCRELLGLRKTPDSIQVVPGKLETYQKLTCYDLVKDAASLLEAYIREHPLPATSQGPERSIP